MTIHGEQVLLRAYLQSADRTPHTPTYQRLMTAARHEGLAGCTVLKGILGFGSRGIIQRSTWSVVQHLPVIVEIVDTADTIVHFLGQVGSKVMLHGMITLERAHVMMVRHGTTDAHASLTLGSMLTPLSTVPKLETKDPMKINENGVLVRVFIGESDRFEQKPLYEAIVQKVRELGLAGATVLRGVEGFGARSVVHKAQLLEMSTDLPMVIEIVDTEEKIKLLLPHLESMVQEGMVTMEHVVILMYRHGAAETG